MNSNDLINNFNEIYDDTYNNVLNLVISKCDNISNIEDIIQDVYSELYEIILKKGTDYIKNYNSFTYDLTKKKIFKYYSLKYKLKNIMSNDIYMSKKEIYEDNVIEEIVDGTDYEDKFLEKYTHDEIYNEILKLDLITQKIVIFYYMQDFKIEDISKVLDLNINTVKTRLYRGINKLKDKFKLGGE